MTKDFFRLHQKLIKENQNQSLKEALGRERERERVKLRRQKSKQ